LVFLYLGFGICPKENLMDCSLSAFEKKRSMPANLNALIRYKTINSSLHGGTRRCSIFDLIEACSDALAESRGRYDKISERTIRDDIRVMRSDILGFNAPIRQQDGLYFYSDQNYSIMSIGISDPELLDKVIRVFLDLRNEVKHPELEILLEKLMSLSPVNYLPEPKDVKIEESEKFPDDRYTDIRFRISSHRVVYSEKETEPKEAKPRLELSWGDLLGFITAR